MARVSLRLLYLSHTGHVSGGERSLLDLLRGLPEDVRAVVACPNGPLEEAVHDLDIETVTLPATDGSLKLHPIWTTRALLSLVQTATRVRRRSAQLQADLVHANSSRAGLAAVLAARLGGPPAVVHLHDSLAPGSVAALTRSVLRAGASGLMANSRHTATSFGLDGFDGAVKVVNNPIDLTRFDPDRHDRGRTRERLNLPATAPVLVMVAQITPWKAQDDAIRTLALIKPKYPEARLLLVGSPKFLSRATRYDNRRYQQDLYLLTRDLELQDSVVFLGEREDVPEILQASDVLLAPSWDEPFGRCIAEGMAMRLPVIATAVGGPSEIIEDGRNGVLLPPRTPRAWAGRVDQLLQRPEERARLGSAGRERIATSFGLEAHVDAVLSLYREALEPRHEGTCV